MPESYLSEELAFAAHIAAVDQQRNYFGLCWPEHCTHCGGWGQFTWREAHGEMLSDQCGNCTAKLICARCGYKVDSLAEVDEPCTNCGWNYDDGLEPH